jgi:hypothetical protein
MTTQVATKAKPTPKPKSSGRPKRYRYVDNASEAWIYDTVPPQGGHYKGSTTTLKVSPDIVWAGDGVFPICIRNRNLKAIIIQCLDGVGMNSAYYEFIQQIRNAEYAIHTTDFVAKEDRTHKWNATKHTEHKGFQHGYTIILVNNLSEDMASCTLEALIPKAMARFKRILPVVSRYGKNEYSARQVILGSWGVGLPDEVSPLDKMKSEFATLGIPYDAEWDRLIAVGEAKRRLTA